MKEIFILNFHGVGPPTRKVPSEELPFWVEAAFFKKVLDLIQGQGNVQITFDDSNGSDYEIALPALKARNMTARMFVLARRLDQKGYLSTGQLCALASSGMTIGNHGMRHRPWTGLNDVDLREELVEGRSRLEQIVSRPVTEAACPFGMYNRRILRALKDAGYHRLYTTDESPAVASCWVQSRYSVLRTHDLAQIADIIRRAPRGFRKAWRGLKLKLRRVV